MSATSSPDVHASEIDFSDIVEGTITTIPLDRLMLSTLNVRRTDRAADVDSLAEDIAARGLKQNLVVVPAHFVSGEPAPAHLDGEPRASGGKAVWEGRFEVIAGGRRFQAMQLLVAQERLSPTFPVPCMIEFRDAAAETSLSENLHRVSMNPADEFEAYRVIVDQARRSGSDPDPVGYCARRFGVTVKHVQGRLRLAALAPEILDALRTNAIGLDSAKAYAGVEDHALQLKVFADHQKNSWKKHNPSTIRSDLRGKTIAATDPVVKFVGLDAYVEAGGRVEAEMFMGSWGDQQRVTDVKLVERLAKEKAEPLVAPRAKKDGFLSGLLATGAGNAAKWPKAPDGMVRYYDYYESKPPTKAQLKKCVAVYAIDSGGTDIEKVGHYQPEPKRETLNQRDWEAERAERDRNWKIEKRAAQLAVYEFGKFAGTPLEGRAFWPASNPNLVQADRDDETFALVAIQIRVPADRIEANRAEAERLIDEEAAAAEREALIAELKAEREAQLAAAQEQDADA